MERRLAAILAADVAGYSRQMEAAEERTAEELAQCQSLIAQTADRLGGRIFNTAGGFGPGGVFQPCERRALWCRGSKEKSCG
jgi:class 3 adenylate cyclase